MLTEYREHGTQDSPNREVIDGPFLSQRIVLENSMAGPTTEVLNDEVKALREDFHRVGSTILDRIHELDLKQAELRRDVLSATALARWAGTIFVATLLGGGVSTIWWGAILTTKVYGMESRVNEKFQELSTRIDKMESKIENRIEKLGRVDNSWEGCDVWANAIMP